MSFKQRINKYYSKRINEDSTLEENPMFAIIVCSFASLFSQLLVIPFLIITAPFIFVFKKYEIQIMRFSLFLMNILSISSVLYFEEYLVAELLALIPFFNFDPFSLSDINLSLFTANTILACLFFSKTIYKNVTENLNKTYGLEWKKLKSKKVPARFFYEKSKQLGRIGTLKNGKEQGLWTYYYTTGELKSKREFLDGKVINETCWDIYGNKESCSKWDIFGNEK